MNILTSDPEWINYFTTVLLQWVLKFHVTIFVMIYNRHMELPAPIPAGQPHWRPYSSQCAGPAGGRRACRLPHLSKSPKFVIRCIFSSYWQYYSELFSKFKFLNKNVLLVFLRICNSNLGRLFVPLLKAHIIQQCILNYRQHSVRHVKIIIISYQWLNVKQKNACLLWENSDAALPRTDFLNARALNISQAFLKPV